MDGKCYVAQILTKRQFNLQGQFYQIKKCVCVWGGSHRLWADLVAFITWAEAQKFNSVEYPHKVHFPDPVPSNCFKMSGAPTGAKQLRQWRTNWYWDMELFQVTDLHEAQVSSNSNLFSSMASTLWETSPGGSAFLQDGVCTSHQMHSFKLCWHQGLIIFQIFASILKHCIEKMRPCFTKASQESKTVAIFLDK